MRRGRTLWAIRGAGVFGAFLFLGGNGVASDPAVEFLPARDYFSTVQRELAKAKSSITVCMYLFSLRPHSSDSPVFKLAESLKKAHDAGVRVEVLLDQNFKYSEGGESGTDLSEGNNAAAYRYFKSHRIPVYFDVPSTYTHGKAVVIDEETVIAGSTNWTDSALKRNQEINFLVRSPRVARDVLASLRAIPHGDPLPHFDDAAVAIPVEFIEDPEIFGRMARESDARAFETVLYLYRVGSLLVPPSSSFEVDVDDLSASIGINRTDLTAHRRQVAKVLKKLQNRYGLIEVHSRFAQNPHVTLRRPIEERAVYVPYTYWSLGWNRRLQFAGNCVFLISQWESQISSRRPLWSVARKTLARRYGLSVGFISQGIVDLRRHNLLDVDYAPLDIDGEKPRRPSIYSPLPLYDPVALDKKLDELKSKFGQEMFTRAQNAAVLVYEDGDVNGIQELIELQIQFGTERFDAAVKLLGEKNADNPKRNMGYLIGTIRKMK